MQTGITWAPATFEEGPRLELQPFGMRLTYSYRACVLCTAV
jgi:hypothetical protein